MTALRKSYGDVVIVGIEVCCRGELHGPLGLHGLINDGCCEAVAVQ